MSASTRKLFAENPISEIKKQIKTMEDVIKLLPNNKTIRENVVKAWSIINDEKYQRVTCSISGGSDSDDMFYIVYLCDINNKVSYVWFDTGIEYQATKDHLKQLENEAKIQIDRIRGDLVVPSSCKKYGQPFLSKRASDYLSRLQRHGFDFSDQPLEVLLKKYPKCKAGIRWWCNDFGDGSSFNIQRNAWLKEFMILNKPNFMISDKCCKTAKKEPVNKRIKSGHFDLAIQGVRKSEGGARGTAYKNCFTQKSDVDQYRPLFFFKNSDKSDLENEWNIVHSDCYVLYGLIRTGCAGCPFGRDFEFELEVIKKFEPKLYKAVMNIFGDSYEYTRRYKEFCKQMNAKYGSYAAYLRMKNEN